MSRTSPSQTLKQVLLRIPDEMRERLEESAANNGLSLTQEVLRRLGMTFPETEGWLSKAQKSPVVRAEKLVIGAEARLLLKLEELEDRIKNIEDRI